MFHFIKKNYHHIFLLTTIIVAADDVLGIFMSLTTGRCLRRSSHTELFNATDIDIAAMYYFKASMPHILYGNVTIYLERW